MRNMINEGDDIIVVNAGSGITCVHLASLTQGSDSSVYTFGIKSETHQQQLNATLERLGAKCILFKGSVVKSGY